MLSNIIDTARWTAYSSISVVQYCTFIVWMNSTVMYCNSVVDEYNTVQPHYDTVMYVCVVQSTVQHRTAV